MLFCSWLLYCTTVILVLHLKMSTSNDNQLKAEKEALKTAEILHQIDSILHRRYNLIRRAEIYPVVEAGLPMAVYDDIKFTLRQAQHILEALSDEGDEEKRRRIVKNERRVFPDEWAKWKMPILYTFDGTHTDEQKDIIREGISWWNLATCVDFQELSAGDHRLDNAQHLAITKGTKCQSNVGNTEALIQTVSLGEGCLSPGIVAHEFGHVLGMFHEHMRPDRDQYIRIILANSAGPADSFSMIPPDYDVDYGTGYDVTSIMHYDSLGFSLNYWGKLRTMETLDPYQMTSMGDRTRLSFNDAKRINIHYGCSAKMCAGVKLAQPCQNGGYQDPKNCVKCRCPFGISGDFCELFAGAWNGAENCGGIVDVTPCSTAVITLPNFPEPYSAEMDCSWLVRTTAGGIIFGQRGQPDMQCTPGDTCIDFFEIRSDLSQLDKSGDRFCMCGKSAGRIGVVDGHQALVYFHSAPNKFKRYNGHGFELHAFATCSDEMPASKVTTECVITESGYDYEGSTFNKSASGRSCMPWAGQTKHSAITFPDDSLLAAGNMCRNPTSQPDGLWCFTDSDYSTAESCNRPPHCAEVAGKQKPDAPTRPATRFTRPTTTTTTTTAATTTTMLAKKQRSGVLANIAKNLGKKPVGPKPPHHKTA